MKMNQAAMDLEQSMRRVEIKKLWKSEKKNLTLVEMSSLSRRFMAYAMESEDYRFLSTAMKLNDRLRTENSPAIQLSEIEALEDDCLVILRKRLGIA